jgi:hypothetical protein
MRHFHEATTPAGATRFNIWQIIRARLEEGIDLVNNKGEQVSPRIGLFIALTLDEARRCDDRKRESYTSAARKPAMADAGMSKFKR